VHDTKKVCDAYECLLRIYEPLKRGSG